jgi:8-oxo-dGTP diphosphatase
MDSPQYVAGFLFRNQGEEVALIRKEKPSWQKNKLNGIGGKIEPGELPYQAMRREFREEAGADVDDWTPFAHLTCGDTVIHFFFSHKPATVETMTNELVEWQLVTNVLGSRHVIQNLKWLIPLALSGDQSFARVHSQFNGK